MRSGPALAALSILAAAGSASAQFNNPWLEYSSNPAMLTASPTEISNNNIEVDFDYDDLDQDGWTDLVVVRKQPFTTPGMRTNVLLMNASGTLRDQSAVYASSTDVAGDLGFLTPTNDRDVEITDVDGDGWLDVVTATTLSDGFPKHISHPRVYRNLGGASTWLGLRFENARIPQMYSFSTGAPEIPDFCGVTSGDVTGNGVPDLYFADYGSMDDRLLINDGSGHFTDQSQLRMTPSMLDSVFGTSAESGDLNQDGVVDIVKNSALGNIKIAVNYNNPANEGFFDIHQVVYTGAAYHTETGDLNNDGRLDVLASDDGSDRHIYNTGVDALGRVIWGPAKTYSFLAGGDDGFGSDNYIVDLDGDGWKDSMHCDVDVDISGCNRRLHLYHNPGGVLGDQITLREERELPGGGTGPGWLGAVGLLASDLQGTHDVAAFDVDNDGDNDLVIGRCVGTFAFENTSPGTVCGPLQYGLGLGGANVAVLSSGSSAQIGTTLEVDFSGFPSDGVAVWVLCRGEAAVPGFLGGTLLVDPSQLVYADSVAIVFGSGSLALGIPDHPGLLGLHFRSQAAMPDAGMPEGWALSSGLEIAPCP